MVRKIVNSITWIIFSICFAITSVVAIAQNSVPGDSTYGIKTSFEKIVLSGYRLVHKDTDYQIDLTKLRFKESQQVLKSPQGGTSLANLNLQILSTQENITSIQDSKTKSSYAKKYINTLKEIKTQLDYEKLSIVNSSPNVSTAISVTSTPTTAGSTVTDQIDETRGQIDDAIDELENQVIDQSGDSSTDNSLLVPTLVPTINPWSSATGASDFEPDPTLIPTIDPNDSSTRKKMTPTPETSSVGEPTSQPAPTEATKDALKATPVPSP